MFLNLFLQPDIQRRSRRVNGFIFPSEKLKTMHKDDFSPEMEQKSTQLSRVKLYKGKVKQDPSPGFETPSKGLTSNPTGERNSPNSLKTVSAFRVFRGYGQMRHEKYDKILIWA